MQQKKYILSDRPVYRQIAEQITADILSCKLRPGQQLQPIRQLSIQYHVNPNTVQHAVDDLKQKRLLAKQSHGLFVTSDNNLISQLKQQQCDKLAETFFQKMTVLGYSKTEVRQMIQRQVMMRSANRMGCSSV